MRRSSLSLVVVIGPAGGSAGANRTDATIALAAGVALRAAREGADVRLVTAAGAESLGAEEARELLLDAFSGDVVAKARQYPETKALLEEADVIDTLKALAKSKDLARIERRLARLESDERALHDRMAEHATAHATVRELGESLSALQIERGALEEEWLSASERLEG